MKAIIAGLSLLMTGTYAAAEEPPTPAAEAVPSRYQMLPVDGGIARLDTATGAVSLCRITATRMACETGADERASFEAKIEALSARVATLESGKGPAAPGNPPALAPDDDGAEFDEALGRMTRVLRAFGGLAKEFDREFGEPEPRSGAAPNRT